MRQDYFQVYALTLCPSGFNFATFLLSHAPIYIVKKMTSFTFFSPELFSKYRVDKIYFSDKLIISSPLWNFCWQFTSITNTSSPNDTDVLRAELYIFRLL